MYAFLTLVVSLLLLQGALSYKILIHPWTTGFNSRLINMQKIGDILAEDGHDVTVLLSNKVRKHNIVKKANVIEYTVPDESFMLESINFVTFPKVTMWNYEQAVTPFFTMTFDYCKSILSDEELMDNLRSKKFDLLFVEMFDDCNRVLVSHFNVPAISWQNHGYGLYSSIFWPRLSGMTCANFGTDHCISDDMTFMEKFTNIVLSYRFNRLASVGRKKYENLARELGIELHDDINLAFEKNIVLLNADHVLHEPWPSMPNQFMISGLFMEPPNPLPKDLERFVQGSAPHGIVVLSFGTMVSSFKRETAEIFAQAFARLPQRVIMRYKGELTNLGNNTMLSDWLPQPDLLSHPLTKAFVTHCGISGTFQAAYLGIPVVTVPLFSEQKYNSHKLIERRGMGVEVDFHTVTVDSLYEALTDVINNSVYKANAAQTSRLIRAHPIPPKKQLRHLVNYTIETGGAKHLIHNIAIHMTWYETIALDVIAIMLGAILLAIAMVTIILYCCVKAICGSVSKKSSKKQKSS